MFNIVPDYLIYCHVEPWLLPVTCQKYERDMRACLDVMIVTQGGTI